MKRLLSILVIVVLISSCQKSEIKIGYDAIIGQWEWVQSSGGFTGWTISPATEGYTSTLQFTKDKYRVFRNDSLFAEGSYKLEMKVSSMTSNKEKVLMLVSDFGPANQRVEFEGKKMFLIDECYDCFISEYIKK
ncbi:MAG: hypothetical protein J5I50_12535 [Chitinophagaceae bacterium]|nr:hypothetical protein [Chitinophagaceae bacterium]